MREVAVRHGIPIFDPQDVNDEESRRQLLDLCPELLVVCDYGQILAPETLAVAPLGGINLHGSLLPKYRGAAPVQWAVLNGETETGTSVIHMTPRLDAGPCLVQHRTAIGPEETAEELERRLSISGVRGVHESIELLQRWDRNSPLGSVQVASESTRAPRLRKSDGEVDWTKSALRIFNQVRGLKPWPGTYTHWLREGGTPLRIILDKVSYQPESESDQLPGTVVAARSNGLDVATGRGLLSITRVQPSGRRVMPVAEFLRGHQLAPGARFGHG
jgi:methionyl-tRNA formyltransferase